MINKTGIMSLYKIDFQNGKSYIGVTGKTVLKRFDQHCKISGGGNPVHAVHRALKLHGKYNAVVKTLAIGCADYILDAEKRAIQVFGTRTPNGYNMTDGGDGVINVSAESKEKIRQWNLGKKMSESAKRKISIAHTGMIRPAGTGKKISDAQKGKIVSLETREKMRLAGLGKTVSPEARKKISDKLKGKFVSEETRAKLSKSSTGRAKSKEAIAKMSIARKGIKSSEASKLKVSISLKLAYAEGRRPSTAGIPKKKLQD